MMTRRQSVQSVFQRKRAVAVGLRSPLVIASTLRSCGRASTAVDATASPIISRYVKPLRGFVGGSRSSDVQSHLHPELADTSIRSASFR